MKLNEKIQHYGLEFLTVFLGVTLSLFAESWRQDRSDLAAQHDSLVQIFNDLHAEQTDMEINWGNADLGLKSARYLIQGVHGHDVDSVSNALTGLGQCSFFIPHQSEYTALKSSGRLTVVEEPGLRQSIIDFYEMDPFIEWLQERDCTLTGDLMDSMLGKVEFAEWPAPDTTRRRRDTTAAGPDVQRPRPDSTARRRPSRFNRRYPRVIYAPGNEQTLSDPALRARIVRLATQRSYLVGQLQQRIAQASSLRDSIRVRLGSDTSAIRQAARPAGPPRSGRRRPLGGQRNP